MNVEVINTGTELLLGKVNTHIAFFGEELFTLGLRIDRQVTVPDGTGIYDALRESLARADVLLVTGGLGPTTDDLTREVASELLGLPLVEDAAVWASISERFARRGIALTSRVRRQAQVPSGATVLPNANGTAPGLYIRDAGDRHLFLLPGPPRELRPMFREQVLPILAGLVPEAARLECQSLLIVGMGESNVEALVGEELLSIRGLELGYCARPGAVEVRLIGEPEIVARAEAIIRGKMPAQIAAEGGVALEEAAVGRLRKMGKTVATAESCTGGALANRITDVPGASEIFRQGFVAYSNEAKIAALGVPEAMLQDHGAVSQQVARAMAEGALRVAQADFALSTTGIAGPGGGTPEKPVGTVHIAIAMRGGETLSEKHAFPTDRGTFKDLAVQAALDLLRRTLG